jgi:hypothetical protein
MLRYFIAPAEYHTPRQFADNAIPTIWLMPEGHLVEENNARGEYLFDILAHLAAANTDILPYGFVFRTDTTATEYPPELAEVIQGALEAIAHAINDYCPTIYPTEKDKTERN